jgi:DNA-binding NtrC family response regulator
MTPVILIIDDEEDLPNLIKDYLDDEAELNIERASSGEEGLEMIESLKPDICMVDMRLPGMNGNEFILQSLKKNPACKYIIHTGSIDYSIPPVLREHGITQQSILFKPVMNLDVYLEKINELLMDS